MTKRINKKVAESLNKEQIERIKTIMSDPENQPNMQQELRKALPKGLINKEKKIKLLYHLSSNGYFKGLDQKVQRTIIEEISNGRFINLSDDVVIKQIANKLQLDGEALSNNLNKKTKKQDKTPEEQEKASDKAKVEPEEKSAGEKVANESEEKPEQKDGQKEKSKEQEIVSAESGNKSEQELEEEQEEKLETFKISLKEQFKNVSSSDSAGLDDLKQFIDRVLKVIDLKKFPEILKIIINKLIKSTNRFTVQHLLNILGNIKGLDLTRFKIILIGLRNCWSEDTVIYTSINNLVGNGPDSYKCGKGSVSVQSNFGDQTKLKELIESLKSVNLLLKEDVKSLLKLTVGDITDVNLGILIKATKTTADKNKLLTMLSSLTRNALEELLRKNFNDGKSANEAEATAKSKIVASLISSWKVSSNALKADLTQLINDSLYSGKIFSAYTLTALQKELNRKVAQAKKDKNWERVLVYKSALETSNISEAELKLKIFCEDFLPLLSKNSDANKFCIDVVRIFTQTDFEALGTQHNDTQQLHDNLMTLHNELRAALQRADFIPYNFWTCFYKIVDLLNQDLRAKTSAENLKGEWFLVNVLPYFLDDDRHQGMVLAQLSKLFNNNAKGFLLTPKMRDNLERFLTNLLEAAAKQSLRPIMFEQLDTVKSLLNKDNAAYFFEKEFSVLFNHNPEIAGQKLLKFKDDLQDRSSELLIKVLPQLWNFTLAQPENKRSEYLELIELVRKKLSESNFDKSAEIFYQYEWPVLKEKATREFILQKLKQIYTSKDAGKDASEEVFELHDDIHDYLGEQSKNIISEFTEDPAKITDSSLTMFSAIESLRGSPKKTIAYKIYSNFPVRSRNFLIKQYSDVIDKLAFNNFWLNSLLGSTEQYLDKFSADELAETLDWLINKKCTTERLNDVLQQLKKWPPLLAATCLVKLSKIEQFKELLLQEKDYLRELLSNLASQHPLPLESIEALRQIIFKYYDIEDTKLMNLLLLQDQPKLLYKQFTDKKLFITNVINLLNSRLSDDQFRDFLRNVFKDNKLDNVELRVSVLLDWKYNSKIQDFLHKAQDDSAVREILKKFLTNVFTSKQLDFHSWYKEMIHELHEIPNEDLVIILQNCLHQDESGASRATRYITTHYNVSNDQKLELLLKSILNNDEQLFRIDFAHQKFKQNLYKILAQPNALTTLAQIEDPSKLLPMFKELFRGERYRKGNNNAFAERADQMAHFAVQLVSWAKNTADVQNIALLFKQLINNQTLDNKAALSCFNSNKNIDIKDILSYVDIFKNIIDILDVDYIKELLKKVDKESYNKGMSILVARLARTLVTRYKLTVFLDDNKLKRQLSELPQSEKKMFWELRSLIRKIEANKQERPLFIQEYFQNEQVAKIVMHLDDLNKEVKDDALKSSIKELLNSWYCSKTITKDSLSKDLQEKCESALDDIKLWNIDTEAVNDESRLQEANRYYQQFYIFASVLNIGEGNGSGGLFQVENAKRKIEAINRLSNVQFTVFIYELLRSDQERLANFKQEIEKELNPPPRRLFGLLPSSSFINYKYQQLMGVINIRLKVMQNQKVPQEANQELGNLKNS